MEEKNCELGRLGQRLKMNEEHNARFTSSSLSSFYSLPWSLSIIIVKTITAIVLTGRWILNNYSQAVSHSGQAAHGEQRKTSGLCSILLTSDVCC